MSEPPTKVAKASAVRQPQIAPAKPKSQPKSTGKKGPKSLRPAPSETSSMSSGSFKSARTTATKKKKAVSPEEPAEDPQEEQRDYREGGYHPVLLGDLYHNRYYIIRKLGWGVYSTVWLSWDLSLKKFVAIKISKSDPKTRTVALNELEMFKVSGSNDNNGRIVKLLDDFELEGVHGFHICMVFEVLGDNLQTIYDKHESGVSLPVVRRVVKQILEGLDHLHRKCHIIHTDIKLDNILIVPTTQEITCKAYQTIELQMRGAAMPSSMTANMAPRLIQKIKKLRLDSTKHRPVLDLSSLFEHFKANGYKSLMFVNEISSSPVATLNVQSASDDLDKVSVKIADLGVSCWIDRKLSDYIQARYYRSPEVIIGAGYGPAADIWSLACVTIELATGDVLFDADDEKEHLVQMISLLGEIPEVLRNGGRKSDQLFTPKGIVKKRTGEKQIHRGIAEILQEEHNWSRIDATQFAEFLRPMFEYLPERRTKAHVHLQHEWLALKD